MCDQRSGNEVLVRDHMTSVRMATDDSHMCHFEIIQWNGINGEIRLLFFFRMIFTQDICVASESMALKTKFRKFNNPFFMESLKSFIIINKLSSSYTSLWYVRVYVKEYLKSL